jgi:formylglycine-generating enzyme required for sulfatase activity
MTRQARLTQAMQRLDQMDRNRVIHVIPDRNRWVVRRERAKRATRILPDREQAIALARALAREADGGEVIVHRRDGTMQEWQVAGEGGLRTVYSYGDRPSSVEA